MRHVLPTHPTVLLAEEDDRLRCDLAGSLSNEGYRVIAVEDGLELFDYLALARGSHGRLRMPDVIVSDVELVGVGGLDACRRVSADERAVPVVLIVPGEQPALWREAERAGASDVIEKPVDVEELRQALALLV